MAETNTEETVPQEPAHQNLAPNYSPESSDVKTKSSTVKLVPILLGIIAVLLVVIVVLVSKLASGEDNTDVESTGVESAEPEAPFEAAMSTCGVADVGEGYGAHIADGGSTLLLNGSGKEDLTGLAYSDQECILLELGMPASVKAQMGSTRSLDGMQNASWDSIDASWTYHPDAGLDLILTMQ